MVKSSNKQLYRKKYQINFYINNLLVPIIRILHINIHKILYPVINVRSWVGTCSIIHSAFAVTF